MIDDDTCYDKDDRESCQQEHRDRPSVGDVIDKAE